MRYSVSDGSSEEAGSYKFNYMPLRADQMQPTLDLLDREPQRRAQLWDNVNYFLNGLRRIGFDTGDAKTSRMIAFDCEIPSTVYANVPLAVPENVSVPVPTGVAMTSPATPRPPAGRK